MSAVWSGQASIWGPNHPTRMALLTICLTGVQLVWGIEMAYCSPYLLSLGLSKSMMSLVWIVGPLSGLVTQPIVGVMADRSTSRWGRRRPVMVIGSALTILGLLALGWTKEIVGIFLNEDSKFGQTVTIIVAVLAMYLLDFSVNAVQACCRALIVDSLPTEDQQIGNAWASRMIAIGNVGGYLAGTIKLKKIFGDFLGDTQFKQLVLVCSFALCLCIGASCLAVRERILVERRGEDAQSGIKHVLKTIWVTVWNMPRRIGAVCLIIFFAWIGWFPFMVYGTTFVGEVLKRYDHKTVKVIARAVLTESDDNLGDIARVGSLALVIFSCVSLGSSFLLPWMIEAPETDELHQKPIPNNGLMQRIAEAIEPYRPDLATAWIFGHVFFAILMFSTLFTRTVFVATCIVAAAGIPWSLMTWAPFSFVGEEINKLGEEEADRISPDGPHHQPQSHDPLLGSSENRSSSNSPRRSSRSNSGERPQQYCPSINSEQTAVNGDLAVEPESENEGKSELAGIYLGILNVFTCLPQFVATFISYVIFSILEPGKSPEFGGGEPEQGKQGVNAIAVVLGIGGISALCAAHYTWQFKNERE